MDTNLLVKESFYGKQKIKDGISFNSILVGDRISFSIYNQNGIILYESFDNIDSLKEMAEKVVSDFQMSNVRSRFPLNPPLTKEEYMYRSIYSDLFPSDSAALCVPSVPSIACSSPVALEWDKAFTENADPSGRAVKTVHYSQNMVYDINELV